MGRNFLKGTVSILRDKTSIRLRWRLDHKRYSINLPKYSPEALRLAKKTALLIEEDIHKGSFDPSLQKYKVIVRPQEQGPNPLQLLSIVEQFEFWVKNYRNKDCERHIDYFSTRNMIKRWGIKEASEVLEKFNTEKFGAATYNRRLTLLSSFFSWTRKQGLYKQNPLEDVNRRKFAKRKNQSRTPFSAAEVNLILSAIKNDQFCPKCSRYTHSHYFPFLYFLFATGVRNGEAIGLRVSNVNLTKRQITINESLARTIKGTNASARIRKDTKTGKSRILPMSEDLETILKPLLEKKKADDLVFTSPTGKLIDDRMFQKRIFSKVLSQLNLRYRVLYACRHTFASRCAEEGVNPVTTAFLMGNSPVMALSAYTHQINLSAALPKLF